MKKTALVIVFSFLMCGTCLSQHCAWDYASIVVVSIKASKADKSCIDNLKITVLDSLDKPVMTSNWNGSDYVDDTLWLWRNPETTTFSGPIDNANPAQPRKIRFWFAEDNYVLETHNYQGHPPKMRLLIEDTLHRYKTKIVALSAADYYPLCNHYSDWDQGREGGFIKGFKPKEVLLKRGM